MPRLQGTSKGLSAHIVIFSLIGLAFIVFGFYLPYVQVPAQSRVTSQTIGSPVTSTGILQAPTSSSLGRFMLNGYILDFSQASTQPASADVGRQITLTGTYNLLAGCAAPPGPCGGGPTIIVQTWSFLSTTQSCRTTITITSGQEILPLPSGVCAIVVQPTNYMMLMEQLGSFAIGLLFLGFAFTPMLRRHWHLPRNLGRFAPINVLNIGTRLPVILDP